MRRDGSGPARVVIRGRQSGEGGEGPRGVGGEAHHRHPAEGPGVRPNRKRLDVHDGDLGSLEAQHRRTSH